MIIDKFEFTNLGYPWLVPHDADPNHTPTMKNGEKSHWGVVTGFCVGLNQSSNIKGIKRWRCQAYINFEIRCTACWFHKSTQFVYSRKLQKLYQRVQK